MNTNTMTVGSGIEGQAHTMPTDRTPQDNRSDCRVLADTNSAPEIKRTAVPTDFGPYSLSRRQ